MSNLWNVLPLLSALRIHSFPEDEIASALLHSHPHGSMMRNSIEGLVRQWLCTVNNTAGFYYRGGGGGGGAEGSGTVKICLHRFLNASRSSCHSVKRGIDDEEHGGRLLVFRSYMLTPCDERHRTFVRRKLQELKVFLIVLLPHRGPDPPRFPLHRHGPPAEGGGENPYGHHAVCSQWKPRPRDLLVQGLPACGHRQQQWTHKTAAVR